MRTASTVTQQTLPYSWAAALPGDDLLRHACRPHAFTASSRPNGGPIRRLTARRSTPLRRRPLRSKPCIHASLRREDVRATCSPAWLLVPLLMSTSRLTPRRRLRGGRWAGRQRGEERCQGERRAARGRKNSHGRKARLGRRVTARGTIGRGARPPGRRHRRRRRS